MNLFLLSVISLVGSVLTAAVGLGGGLLLLAVMPSFVPISAVVPLQGAVNLASNGSRAVFGRKEVIPKSFGAYVFGGILGTALGFGLIGSIPEKYLSVILGLFIIAATWTEILKLFGKLLWNDYLLSLFQSFLSLFVGSVAAISIPILLKRGATREQTIATNAMQMAVLNTFRVAAFVIAGFKYQEYWAYIGGMLFGAIVGTFIGGKLKGFISEKAGVLILKVLTTLLAVKMLFV